MLQLNRKDVAQVDLGDVLPMLHFVSKVLLQALFQNVSLVSRRCCNRSDLDVFICFAQMLQ